MQINLVAILTSRKRSLGQGNFLHMCVILFTEGCLCSMSLPAWLPGLMFLLGKVGGSVSGPNVPSGVYASWGRGGSLSKGGGFSRDLHSPVRDLQPPILTSSDWYWSGWYASYWNAYFLFQCNLLNLFQIYLVNGHKKDILSITERIPIT